MKLAVKSYFLTLIKLNQFYKTQTSDFSHEDSNPVIHM
jgi:hypothetical protein